jgi:hypothetical protein
VETSCVSCTYRAYGEIAQLGGDEACNGENEGEGLHFEEILTIAARKQVTMHSFGAGDGQSLQVVRFNRRGERFAVNTGLTRARLGSRCANWALAVAIRRGLALLLVGLHQFQALEQCITECAARLSIHCLGEGGAAYSSRLAV